MQRHLAARDGFAFSFLWVTGTTGLTAGVLKAPDILPTPNRPACSSSHLAYFAANLWQPGADHLQAAKDLHWGDHPQACRSQCSLVMPLPPSPSIGCACA